MHRSVHMGANRVNRVVPPSDGTAMASRFKRVRATTLLPTELGLHSIAIFVLLTAVSSTCARDSDVPLKLIGLIQQSSDDRPSVAVFRDSASRKVFSAREGDLVAGEFRIVRLFVDSAELVHVRSRERIILTLTGDDDAATNRSDKPRTEAVARRTSLAG